MISIIEDKAIFRADGVTASLHRLALSPVLEKVGGHGFSQIDNCSFHSLKGAVIYFDLSFMFIG